MKNPTKQCLVGFFGPRAFKGSSQMSPVKKASRSGWGTGSIQVCERIVRALIDPPSVCSQGRDEATARDPLHFVDDRAQVIRARDLEGFFVALPSNCPELPSESAFEVFHPQGHPSRCAGVLDSDHVRKPTFLRCHVFHCPPLVFGFANMTDDPTIFLPTCQGGYGVIYINFAYFR